MPSHKETASKEKMEKCTIQLTMHCYCKRLNNQKVIKRPPNAFILFRKSFSQLLKDANVFNWCSLANLSGGPDATELERFGIHTSDELIEIVSSCLSYPNFERFKSTEVSRYVSMKWNTLSSENKKHWFDLAQKERELHQLKFPKYKFCPVRNKVKKRGLSVNQLLNLSQGNISKSRRLSAGSDNPSSSEESFELCGFCKLKMEQEPQVTRSQSWNKRYYELGTVTIDLEALKENLGVSQELNSESVTDLFNNVLHEKKVRKKRTM